MIIFPKELKKLDINNLLFLFEEKIKKRIEFFLHTQS